MKSTEFLAIYGTIVSTVALVWNIFRDSLDDPKVKLEAMVGKIYPDHIDRDYLFLTITNVGRRSVLIKGWYALKKKTSPKPHGMMVVTQGLPRLHKKAESHNEYCTDLTILEKELDKLFVSDSAGREWRLPNRRLKRLMAEQ